jgi:hypothetical protein
MAKGVPNKALNLLYFLIYRSGQFPSPHRRAGRNAISLKSKALPVLRFGGTGRIVPDRQKTKNYIPIWSNPIYPGTRWNGACANRLGMKIYGMNSPDR